MYKVGRYLGISNILLYSDSHNLITFTDNRGNENVKKDCPRPCSGFKNNFDEAITDKWKGINTKSNIDIGIEAFDNELKNFVMLTKNLLLETNDRRAAMSEMIRPFEIKPKRRMLSSVKKLNNCRKYKSEENFTSTEIIFQNSVSFEWSQSDTRIISIYKNRRETFKTSSETLNRKSLTTNEGGKNMEKLNSHFIKRESNKTIEPLSSTDRIRQKHRSRKTKTQRNELMCARNFIKTNKNLTKYILQGRQKVHIMEKKNNHEKCEIKQKARPATKKKNTHRQDEEVRKDERKRSDEMPESKKGKEYGQRNLDNIIITDVLYLV